MDPLSIAASCIGITAGIATLAERITAFVSSVREARKDLDAVRRELGSLQLSLSALSDEDASFGFDRTPLLKENLLGVLRNCGGIVDEISNLLRSMEGDGDGKMAMGKKLKWATTGKGEMSKLRVGLEAHKSALDIALDLIAISITADIKQDTSDLKEDTGKIKEDTDQILQEIGNLRVQFAQMEVTHDRGYMMKRFLESSVTYAESVANPQDFDKDIDDVEQPPRVPNKIPEYSHLQEENGPQRPPFQLDRRPAHSEKTTPSPSPPRPLFSSLSDHRRHPSLPDQLSYTVRLETASPKVPQDQYRREDDLYRKPQSSSNSIPFQLPHITADDSIFVQAAKNGDLTCMRSLVSRGANINCRNKQGQTSLYVVIEQNKGSHDNCLKFLLDNGATMENIDQKSQDAFSLAYNLGNQRAMEIIITRHPENTDYKAFYSIFLSDNEIKEFSFLQHAVALADFEARNACEISLSIGSAISEVHHIGAGLASGWSRGEYGQFPANLIRPLDPPQHRDLLLREAQSSLPIWRDWTGPVGNSKHYAKFLRAVPRPGREILVEMQTSETVTRGFPIYWFCINDLQHIERLSGLDLSVNIAKAKTAVLNSYNYRLTQLKPTQESNLANETRAGASSFVRGPSSNPNWEKEGDKDQPAKIGGWFGPPMKGHASSSKS